MKKELISLNKKYKYVVMLAPSFIAEFNYPEIFFNLKRAGFDKIVELTFGAKLVNEEYHKILKDSDELKISTVCPGIVQTIKNKFPQYEKNLLNVDSPMVATAKICKKIYPQHKTVFISPCELKKIEAQNSKSVDYVLDYQQLRDFFGRVIKKSDKKLECSKKYPCFDLFYNGYTRIYPLAGGLSKTAHLKGIIKPEESRVIDGISKVQNFLTKPEKNIKFLDATFCKGGCIGGPCVSKSQSLVQKKKRVLEYLKKSKHHSIPESNKGITLKAEGIKFTY